MGDVQITSRGFDAVGLDDRSAKLSLIVGVNLRRLRRSRGVSLEQLSQLSGVSRAMLGQIETGKSAPTINLLDRVAQALGVSIASLMASPNAAAAIILPKDRATVLTSAEGRFLARAILPWAIDHGFNLFDLVIHAAHRETLPPAPPQTKKILLVTEGMIEATVAHDSPARLSEGDAILFAGDVEHGFFNPGPSLARAFLVVAPFDIGVDRQRSA